MASNALMKCNSCAFRHVRQRPTFPTRLNRLHPRRTEGKQYAWEFAGTQIESIRSIWGPLGSELVAGCRHHLEELLKAPATEAWLAALHSDAPEYEELYRDPAHGF